MVRKIKLNHLEPNLDNFTGRNPGIVGFRKTMRPPSLNIIPYMALTDDVKVADPCTTVLPVLSSSPYCEVITKVIHKTYLPLCRVREHKA